MKQIIFAFLFLICLKAQAMDVFCNGAPTTVQANGGGNVALTAIVDSTVFVGPNASVCEYATLLGNAQINDSARVYGYARVSNGTIVSGTAEVFGSATLTSNPTSQIIRISDSAKVYGNAIVLEGSTIKSSARVYENARVSGSATIDETAQIFGSATVTGTAQIKGASKIHGTAYMGLNIVATGTTTNICVITRYPINTVLTDIVNCPTSPPLESTSQVAAGGAHTCILLTNGRMKCWGSNSNGQLGLNMPPTNIGDDELPKAMPYVALGVSKIAAGLSHTCSIISGSARCWGLGTSGQLGNGTLLSTTAPGGIINLGTEIVNQIVAGSGHTCALLNTGKVRCWGDNTFGQLGYGNTTQLLSPVVVDVNIGGIATQITAGSFHTCALLNTMEVRCWGRAAEGQLGYGNLNNIGDNEAPSVAGKVNFDDISGDKAIQVTAGANHTCVLTVGGNVHCWGLNNVGQLGYGYTLNIGDDELPATTGDINLGGAVTKISSGLGNHTCAVLTAGNIFCWGSNNSGQLGYGNTNNIGDDEPALVAGEVKVGDTITQITTGASHTCALLSTKGVRCWGLGTNGQLGYGNTTTIGDSEFPSSIGNVASQFVEKNKKYWRKNEN